MACMMRKRPNTANNVPMGRISRPVRSLVKRATASATVRASPTSSLVKVVLSARTGINESGSKIAPVLSPSFQTMYDAICDSDFSRAGKPVTSIAVEANARTSWNESAHLARRSRLSYSVIESGIFHLKTKTIAGGSDITLFFDFRRTTNSPTRMPSYPEAGSLASAAVSITAMSESSPSHGQLPFNGEGDQISIAQRLTLPAHRTSLLHDI